MVGREVGIRSSVMMRYALRATHDALEVGWVAMDGREARIRSSAAVAILVPGFQLRCLVGRRRPRVRSARERLCLPGATNLAPLRGALSRRLPRDPGGD